MLCIQKQLSTNGLFLIIRTTMLQYWNETGQYIFILKQRKRKRMCERERVAVRAVERGGKLQTLF